MERLRQYRTSLANGLLVHKLLLLLRRIGIAIEPYRFYQEVIGEPPPAAGDAGVSGLEFFEAGPADVEGIAALDPRRDGREEIRRAFARGSRCFALRHAGRILAVSWCEVRELDFAPLRRPLDRHEAYLYGMETLHQYRGRNLAPRLRALCHRALAGEGRDLIYSYSDRFNRPAVRFKEKLGARLLFTGLSVRLFGLQLLNRASAPLNGVLRASRPDP